MLNFCDFIQVFVFTRNHHLKAMFYPAYNIQNEQVYIGSVIFMLFLYKFRKNVNGLYVCQF